MVSLMDSLTAAARLACIIVFFVVSSKTVWQENFDGAKFHGNASRPSEEIFTVFIFTERMCDAQTTPLLPDDHTPHVNQRNDTERQSEEASL